MGCQALLADPRSWKLVWPPRQGLLQTGVKLACEPPRTCFMACFHGLQLILCKHILDVLSGPAMGMEPEGCSHDGHFALREDSETESPVKHGRRYPNSLSYNLAVVIRGCLRIFGVNAPVCSNGLIFDVV